MYFLPEPCSLTPFCLPRTVSLTHFLHRHFIFTSTLHFRLTHLTYRYISLNSILAIQVPESRFPRKVVSQPRFPVSPLYDFHLPLELGSPLAPKHLTPSIRHQDDWQPRRRTQAHLPWFGHGNGWRSVLKVHRREPDKMDQKFRRSLQPGL
jgi:hypothetical protein